MQRMPGAAAPPRPRPHPTPGLSGPAQPRDRVREDNPTAGQTHRPGEEGGGGASAGLHVTRPQRRQRLHVGFPSPTPPRARAAAPPAARPALSRTGPAARSRPRAGVGAGARVPGTQGLWGALARPGLPPPGRYLSIFPCSSLSRLHLLPARPSL